MKTHELAQECLLLSSRFARRQLCNDGWLQERRRSLWTKQESRWLCQTGLCKWVRYIRAKNASNHFANQKFRRDWVKAKNVGNHFAQNRTPRWYAPDVIMQWQSVTSESGAQAKSLCKKIAHFFLTLKEGISKAVYPFPTHLGWIKPRFQFQILHIMNLKQVIFEQLGYLHDNDIFMLSIWELR